MKTTLSLLFAGLLLMGCSNQGGSAQEEADQYFATQGDFAGSHILVAFEGAQRAAPTITRTKEEALAKAKTLIDQLGDAPTAEAFAELATQESDGPSASRGGDLGSWNRGQMVPEFDTAIATLEEGSLTPEPVETGFGYHIIRRNPNKVKHYAAYGFFVSYQGASPLAQEVTRTKEEADALAQELAGQITADNFDALAEAHNDFGDGAVPLGVFTENDQVPAELIETIQSLGYGEAGGPVELPIGYAFIQRLKVEQYAGAHVLVAFSGAERADSSITRTKEEALARAQELAQQAQTNPDAFAELARENSDGPSAARGGDLGVWFRGMMAPPFDEAISQLEENGITAEPVETDFGYHIIQRRAVPAEGEGDGS